MSTNCFIAEYLEFLSKTFRDLITNPLKSSSINQEWIKFKGIRGFPISWINLQKYMQMIGWASIIGPWFYLINVLHKHFYNKKCIWPLRYPLASSSSIPPSWINFNIFHINEVFNLKKVSKNVCKWVISCHLSPYIPFVEREIEFPSHYNILTFYSTFIS